MTAPEPETRAQFRRASVIGSLLAVALDLLLLVGPQASLVQDGGLLGGFFDAQGHAFLGGHLAIPPGSVGFEGFVVDGATYEYFGPVPALLRLPVLAVTHGLDQRLTQLSMLLALAVLLTATAGLHWRVRAWLRGTAPLSPGEASLTALLQVAVGAGSIALYLATRPVVYHETELWGAALAVASLWAAVGVLERPTARRIALAGVVATLTINTRVSVGLVPLLALAVVGAVLLKRGRATPRTLLAIAAAALLALASSAVVNEAKFHQPFGIPIERQVASTLDPGRRAALAANGGTIFGRQFAPTTLLAAVRPDAVGVARGFPWIGLPTDPPHVVGDVRFDTLQPSLSATTSMTLLCVLTLVGSAGAVRGRRWEVLGLLLAAAGGFAGALSIGYVTSRYLADALPLLALGGALGLQAVAAGGRHRALLPGMALLLALGVLVNGGAGLLEQRLTSPTTSEAQRASWVRTQDRVDAALGRGPHGVSRGPALPPVADRRVGDLAIVGDCDGLFVLDTFRAWAPVERTPRTGQLLTTLRPGAPPTPVATVGRGTASTTLVVRHGPSGVRAAFARRGETPGFGAPVATEGRVRLDLSVGPGLDGRDLAIARLDGQDAALVGLPRGGPRAIVPRVPADPRQTPVCDRLARRDAGKPR